MADAVDSKSIVRKDVRVQVPPRAPAPPRRRPTHRRRRRHGRRPLPVGNGGRPRSGSTLRLRCSRSPSPARARSGPAWVGRGSTTRAGSWSRRPSDIAGRDVAQLLLDADADELKDTRNAQLTTFVSSLMVLDAVERLGIEPSFCAGHSLGEYTALTATGALGVRRRRAARRRAGRRHARRRRRAQPGTMAAVLGLDDDQVEVACRRADADVWVANYNAPGQVVIAGSPEGVAAASVARQGARRQEGDAAAGVGRVPHAVHDARPATGCARRSPTADPRDTEVPVVANVDALPHHEGKEWASLLSAQLSSPGALEAVPARARRPRRHRASSSSAPAACSPAWPSARSPAPATISRRTRPRTSTSCSSGCAMAAPTRSGAARGRAPLRHRAARRQPGGRDLRAGVRASPTGATIDVGTVLGHVGDHEVRSPFAGMLQSYIAVATERVTTRQPIAWLRTDADE